MKRYVLTPEDWQARAKACMDAAEFLDRLLTDGGVHVRARWAVINALLAMAKRFKSKGTTGIPSGMA